MTTLYDSSVWASYFLVNDVNHEKAVSFIEGSITVGERILLPEFVHVEVINTLWRITHSEEEVERCKSVFRELGNRLQQVFGDRYFWVEYVEHCMKRVVLKSSDLIIASYGSYLHVERFESFDVALQREFQKLRN